MKWTLDWLHDYLDTDATAAEIADKLTAIGLEVEEVIYPVLPIAARIVLSENIDGTHLHKLRVDDGSGTLRDVVCGAPNARAGLLSALALPGCLIQGNEIKAGKIRGFVSNGMMCSAAELGISDDNSGIIELDEAKESVGQPVSSLTTCMPTIFDAGITPNRPDYLGVRGIARDLSAADMGKLKVRAPSRPYLSALHPSVAGNITPVISNLAACPVYSIMRINNVNAAPSEPLISARLTAIGINPKNAMIDATNYICFDMGQPMHCYDADKIVGNIVVRNALESEVFTDLFGTERVLTASDLVIADDAGVLALAGIIGGARVMTTDETKNIILESAYFTPGGIRRTAHRLGISTDASYRYERGTDSSITMDALAHCADIITHACGGEVEYMASAGAAVPRVAIEYNPETFTKITGVVIPQIEQGKILKKLGYDVWIGDGGTILATPPAARVNIEIPENIVADIMRIYGYQNIIQNGTHVSDNHEYLAVEPMHKHVASLGLNEIKTYGFGNSADEKIVSCRPQIMIENPIIDTMDTARNTIISGMLRVIADNNRFRRNNMNVYEVGTVFDGDMPNMQHEQLVIARTGIRGAHIGTRHGDMVTIYDVRDNLLKLFPSGSVQNDVLPEPWENPYRAGVITIDGRIVARFGELHPRAAKHFGIKTNVVLGVTDETRDRKQETGDTATHALTSSRPHASINDFPDFPLTTRDFAFIVDTNVNPKDIETSIKSVDTTIFDTNIFDVFDMPDGRKSVAIEITIQPTENMTDSALAALQQKIIDDICSGFHAEIRDK